MKNAPERLRLALVSPRYAAGAAGGAEVLIQHWAEKLAQRGHDVEVLTTCAKSHFTWENHFPPGTGEVGGVRVNRFPVNRRDTVTHQRIQDKIARARELTPEEEEAWLDNGVTSDDLLRHLEKNRSRYDSVVFAPYLFGLTYRGVLAVPEKAVLVPCLHNEPFAYMKTTARLFASARAVFFNTPGEQDLAHSLFAIPREKSRVVGMGVEPPDEIRPQRFAKKFGLRRPFILYAGRREEGKNTPLLIEYFRLLQSIHETPPALDLVLAGSGPVSVPGRAGRFVIDAGYLEERQKWNAYGAAWAFCQPSVNESFSIVLLEAWLAGTPALVNERCPVTLSHCRLSGGGLWFRDYYEFEECVFHLLEKPELAAAMGEAGRDYVRKNYSWKTIIGKLETALAEVRDRS
jgi:glycosyltransferase involved in cell wall biosynthesis